MNNNLVGDEVGKLFVGGLDWSTTQETLRNYFSQYGEVVDCVIMKDKTTNQSRGFGFVKFKDPNCVRTVLETKPHNLDGRNIDPKPCTPRGMQPEKSRTKEGWKGSKADSNKSKKIFVGGIPHNCGEPELRDYFNRFGVVTEVVMIYDAEKQRPRGFGFITFEAEQSVDQAVNMHFHDIMGKKVEVKKAEPRDSKAPGQLGPGQWAPRGILSAANGWTAQPAQGWQQPYGPQGVWVSTTGQPIDLFSVGAGGYGPPLTASRGTPTQPPSPFNAFLVTTPAGSFAAPQAYPQQGYSTAPQFEQGQGGDSGPEASKDDHAGSSQKRDREKPGRYQDRDLTASPIISPRLHRLQFRHTTSRPVCSTGSPSTHNSRNCTSGLCPRHHTNSGLEQSSHWAA
ncbi:DAZ-associated protein 1 isoform X5 [Epinephelus fuscoguttatus]|uniref:DAZ-associated protein 1 isoform X5 n=1 Tax=Epinephelus fuscoguttatus TaxID=293821 RepID=UPI0020D1E4DD|nr:DAZ-associated protein 1 isoform X5 [Epinephelus fuscoguttatus]